ncbi:RMD1 family protein [Teredinibacter turnerae]|uniref:RMD1 family protein n=1 Tax=Teredinibacter turnerae TaxID=2426 RepID=UPI00037DB738|nr:RMD1 family protein [Teredinibacter turnerae]
MSTQSSSAIKRITIALLGRNINTDRREEVLIEKLGAVRYRDAYAIRTVAGEAWLFDYGVLVGWDLPEDLRQQLVNDLEDIIEDPSANSLTEHYSYTIDSGQPFSVQHDMLSIPDQEQLTRLGLSHAFAQSAKLGFFEDAAQQVIQRNAHISKQLAATGKVPLSRRELAKLRGVLFDTSSDITLHFNLLDTPEFFWDYPELEAGYLRLAKYLDLAPRIEIMNKKLGTIHELLDMLAAEQHHKHSAFLEWIIIVLIAVDIVVYFF